MRRRRGSRIVAAAVAAMAALAGAAGCAQPGTQAPRAQAARIGVATNTISTACGYAEELTAFGGRRPAGLAAIEAMALGGVRKLLAVYAHDRDDIYQGQTVGSVVSQSIALLGECGLGRARATLLRGSERARR